MKAEKEKLILQSFPERPHIRIRELVFHVWPAPSVTKTHPEGIFPCTECQYTKSEKTPTQHSEEQFMRLKHQEKEQDEIEN